MVARTRRRPTRAATEKHAESIREIIGSDPKVVKIRYTGTTITTIQSAWRKWQTFCARPEVTEAFAMADPAVLCRNLTPNLVRAFLYWMCSTGNFEQLDSMLSHARHWRMAVKDETQCNVSAAIGQDMSLYINNVLKDLFRLNELKKPKAVMSIGGFISIMHFHWTQCHDWYPCERDRVQHACLNLFCYSTSARPGTIIEGGGYRDTNESDSLKYKDIRFHVVRDSRRLGRVRILMLARLRLMKGYRNRGSPPWFVYYERPDVPCFCIVTHVLSLAFADQAFASPWIRTPQDIRSVKIPTHRAGIPLEFDPSWLETPLLRRSVRVNGAVTTSRTKPAQYTSMNTWNIRLGRSYGLEHKFYFYCLRRAAGSAFNRNMTVAERMQAMGHHRADVYDKHYLNEVIETSTLDLLLETPSDKEIMDLASHMCLTRDPNAPSKPTAAHISAAMAHPDLVRLRTERDARKVSLPGKGRRLNVAQVEDPLGFTEYCRLRKEFDSLRHVLVQDTFEQARAAYFDTVGARYIDQQQRGCAMPEPFSAAAFEVAERLPLAQMLFPEVAVGVKREDVVEWPSDTYQGELVTLLAKLCVQCCALARRTQCDEQKCYIEVEEDQLSPKLYPMVCPSTVCLFCLGNTLLPPKDRERHFSKRTNLQRHVQTQHLRSMPLELGFICPHPACTNRYLQGTMEFFNHAEREHNVRH